MKKGILFLILSVLTLGAWADDTSTALSPTRISDIRTYTGTDKFVYSIADGKEYAYNNLNRYEEYGVYQTVKFSTPDYVEVEYIETKEGNQTYLNTGYIIKANSQFVMDCNITHRTTKYVALFGGRNDWNNKAFGVFERFDNLDAGCYALAQGSEQRGSGTFPTGSRVKVYTNNRNCYVYKDGDTNPNYTITNSVDQVAGERPLYIFTINNNNSPTSDYSYAKLYGFKIYEGDELKHDFVPIVDSSEKGGLLDKITGTIILSATNTDFNKSNTFATGKGATNKGVSTYKGKLVVNSDNNIEYLWDGTQWVPQGCVVTPSAIDSYEGSEEFVYSSADGKMYARNNLGEYEEYGVFGKTHTLKLAGNGQADYLRTTGSTYFNTGYVPKYNTKVRATAIVDPGTGEWQALYGCGFEDTGNGGWQKRYAFFSKADGRGRAAIQLTSQKDVRCGAIFGRKAIYELDGTTGVGTIYAEDGTTTLETVTGNPQTNNEDENCKTPMYIFADNNTLPNASEPNPRSYSNNTSIFRVQIFEGGTLVHDYIPYVYNGTAGFYDNKDNDMNSSFQSSKFLSPTGSNVTAGTVTAYEGKIVRYTSDNHAYKYTAGEWVDQGAMTFSEINNTNYKDMNNWSANAGHQSIFTNHIDYSNDVNTISYKGTGGWEPLVGSITVESGEEYNFSFKYQNSGENDAEGWEGGRLRASVRTEENKSLENYLHGDDPNHLLTYKHGIEVPVSMDFTASQSNLYLYVQFGAVKDDIDYEFKFSNLKVAKYVYPVAYNENAFARATIYPEYVYAEEGDYYLYNVGSGLWLQDNNRNPSEWTTRAELGDRGMNVGVSTISGGYKLNPYFGHNQSLNGGAGLLYMDTTQPETAWTISSVPGTDYVTIKSGDNFLGSDGSANKYLTVSSSLSGENAYWKMYTADEYYNVRKTEMLTATQDSPKDATWMIKDPKFGYNDEREKDWIIDKSNDGNVQLRGDTPESGGVKCNRVWEAWNTERFSMKQELMNLPEGVYRMSVQGLYNCNSNSKLPYYFVQNTTSGEVNNYFMPASEGEHESTGGCATSAVLGGGDGQFWASKCIYEGHYQNPWIYFIVGSDNEATTIGVKKEGKNGEDWLVYDNFKLEYLGSGYEISFNENNTSIDEIIGLATRITMTRSMQNDRWNTFCVPFAMTGSQITEQFGSSTQVKELTGAVQNGENYTMTFTDADAIVAGKPYMVKPANNVSSIELTDANGIAVNTTGTPSVTKDGVTFTGVYTNGLAPRESFIISNNVFYLVDSDVTLKAFRGYITTASGGNVKALDFTFDDDATGISLMEDGRSQMEDGAIYNLAGQRISKMQKGINIVNGKKIMVN